MQRRIGERAARLPQFSIKGDAGQWGQLQIEAKWFTFTVGQKIRRKETEEMFNSVGVYCNQEHNGALVIRVVVFHPDWAAPLQVAKIESRPESQEELLESMGINLDHIALSRTEWRRG